MLFRMLFSAKGIVCSRKLLLVTTMCVTALYCVPLMAQTERPGTQPRLTPDRWKDTNQIVHALDAYKAIELQNPDSSLDLFREVLLASERLGFKYGIARSLFGLSLCYADMNSNEQAIPYLRKAIGYCRNAHYDSGILLTKLYVNMGAVHLNLSRLDTAAYYTFLAMEEIRIHHLEQTPAAAFAFINMARAWLALGETGKASSYLQTGEKLAREQKLDDALLLALNVKGNILQIDKRLPESYAAHKEALVLARKSNLLIETQAALLNLGIVLVEQGEFEQAISYLTQAATCAPKIRSIASGLNPYLFLSIAYYQQQKYKEAEKSLLHYLKGAEAYGIKEHLQTAYFNLSSIYATLGNFKKAFEYQSRYVQSKDSLSELEKTKIVSQLEVKYKIAEKDRNIADKQVYIIQQQQRIFNKNILIGCLLTALVMITLILMIIYKHKHHSLKQQQEIKALQAMMEGEEKERSRLARELHDGIGGMLAYLKMNFSMLQKQYRAGDPMMDFDEARQIIDDTAIAVRETAHNLMPEPLVRYGLVEAIRIFCTNVHKNTDLTIDFQHIGAISKLNTNFQLFLYRVIQELVQNIIKHANATSALIQISQHDDHLHIMVEDNGIGMSTLKQREGMGLKSLETRVLAMEGQFSIESGNRTGTAIYLEFHLQKLKALSNGHKTGVS